MAWIFILDAVIAVLFWGVGSVADTLAGEKVSAPVAGMWLSFAGLAVGASSAFILAQRVLPSGPFIGISVVVTPLALAGVMEGTGRYQLRRRRRLSHLTTWWGGAAFGLGLAAGRLGGLVYLEAL